MKTIPAALKTHFALETTTIATCWKVTLKDGTVKGFTDHDADLVIDGVTYLAASGYTASNLQKTDGLNVDALELQGVLSSDSITEADLMAGIWDYAAIEIFMVNWATLAQGALIEQTGHIGEVTIDRGQFKAELRGLTQFYARSLGQLTSASCRASLGDARCQVDMTPFTVTGTLTGVATDNMTVYDTSRAEPGPTGGVAINGISNANPGIVTMDSTTGLYNGLAVALSGIVGPTALNTITIIRNLVNDHWSLGIDTTDTSMYPAYVSGGTVTPLGSNSGYFDGGVMTFTSGANDGIAMEVKSYIPGQIMLALPLPYTAAIGDTYTLTAGCDKSLTTCQDKFDNIVNFRGEPYLPGLDKMISTGRHT